MFGSSSAAARAFASASIFRFWAAVGFFPPTFGVSALSLGSKTAFFLATFDSWSSDLALLLAPLLVGILKSKVFLGGE